MAQSFTAAEDGALAKLKSPRRKVLVTGAAGNIGSYFAEHSHAKYDLRLMVRESADAAEIKTFGEIVIGDITDLPRMKEVCKGVDTVLHLAASASPSTAWDDALHLNIAG